MSTEDAAVLYGIGNPLMDVIVRAEDGTAEALDVAPGSMNLVDYPRQQQALAAGTVVRRLPGGSCANTIRGTRWLMRVAGSTAVAAYTGGVGEDSHGDGFEGLLDEEGVLPLLARKPVPTGTSVIVVTPDSQRTMFTFLGACQELGTGDLDQAALGSAKVFHTTGYMWDTTNQEQAARRAVALARENGALVSFDIADRFVVDRYRDSLLGFIPSSVDVLFANESELVALTGEEGGGRKTLSAARTLAPTIIMKTGPRGCLVLTQDGIIESPAHPVAPTDTTGAGDAFAGGYLFGLIQKQPPEICARVANRLAGGIVVVDGCNYDALDSAAVATSFDGFVGGVAC